MRICLLAFVLSTTIGCYYGPRNTSKAMIAKHDLPAGMVIQESDIVTVERSSTVFTPEIARTRSEIIGHRTLRQISEGELFRLPALSQKPVPEGTPVYIPEKKVIE